MLGILDELISPESEAEFFNFELMTDEQGNSYLFTEPQLLPFTLDGKHFVAHVIRGQGEQFLALSEVDKETSTYILKYVDINFIKE